MELNWLFFEILFLGFINDGDKNFMKIPDYIEFYFEISNSFKEELKHKLVILKYFPQIIIGFNQTATEIDLSVDSDMQVSLRYLKGI